jgi:hypothetical protein
LKKRLENHKALNLQDNQEKKREHIRRKVTARGLRTVPKAREGVNHRGDPSGRRYAIIPSRAVYSPDLSPNDLLLLCTLGLFVSRQGVSYPTYETIRNCSGLGATQVSASLKRLINAGMIRKLQPKWFPQQSSKWMTSRYQVLFSSNDPIPTDEEMKASIPYATDSVETYTQVEQKTSESETKDNDKLIGIKRDIQSIASTYGINIAIDSQSLGKLAESSSTKEQIALAFRLHLNRFGSLPPTLAVLLQRGCFV